MSAHGTRTWMNLVAVALCLSLALSMLSLAPDIAAARPSDQSVSACAHVLEAGSRDAGPTVECFLNATGILTFEPSKLSVPANSTVIFEVGVVGALPHNFTLDSITNDTNLSVSMSTNQLFGYFNSHRPLAYISNLNISGPAWVTAPVKMPRHGIFEYVCEYPGHFQQGMFGELFVGMAAPPPVVQPTQPSFVQGTMLLIAFVAIAVAAILLIVVMVRGPPGGGRGSRPAWEGAPEKKVQAPSGDS